MGIFLAADDDYLTVEPDGKRLNVLKKDKFEEFNPSILGLGDISAESNQIEALSAMFDLSGFTQFCKQVDPHLAVPEYLSTFLDWIFGELRDTMKEKEHDEGVKLWAPLLFLSKFLGDGLLFVWNTHGLHPVGIHNIVGVLNNICKGYITDLLPKVRKVVVDPPEALRCGIARGHVYSIGNGKDFVGPCINISARLQKLSLLSFCFSARGFHPDKHMAKKINSQFILKTVSIRGIGSNELVYVRKDEFETLIKKEAKLFQEPA